MGLKACLGHSVVNQKKKKKYKSNPTELRFLVTRDLGNLTVGIVKSNCTVLLLGEAANKVGKCGPNCEKSHLSGTDCDCVVYVRTFLR